MSGWLCRELICVNNSEQKDFNLFFLYFNSSPYGGNFDSYSKYKYYRSISTAKFMQATIDAE